MTLSSRIRGARTPWTRGRKRPSTCPHSKEDGTLAAWAIPYEKQPMYTFYDKSSEQESLVRLPEDKRKVTMTASFHLTRHPASGTDTLKGKVPPAGGVKVFSADTWMDKEHLGMKDPTMRPGDVDLQEKGEGVVVVLVLGLFGIVEVVVVLVLVFFLVFGVGLGLGSGGCGGSGGNVLVTVALLPSLQLFLLLSAFFCHRHLCSPSMLLLQSDPYRQSETLRKKAMSDPLAQSEEEESSPPPEPATPHRPTSAASVSGASDASSNTRKRKGSKKRKDKKGEDSQELSGEGQATPSVQEDSRTDTAEVRRRQS
eukprot:s7065_g2.t1